MALKTNYVDDILNTNKNTKRRYNMIQNSDGTVSFEDVTDYKQVGDSFGSADVNSQNKEINKIGNTSISGIGDGTLTGAISELNSDLAEKQNSSTAINTSNIAVQSVNYANSSGSCSGNASTSNVAAKIGHAGNVSYPMTFTFTANSKAPTYVWGANEIANSQVYALNNLTVGKSAKATYDDKYGYHIGDTLNQLLNGKLKISHVYNVYTMQAGVVRTIVPSTAGFTGNVDSIVACVPLLVTFASDIAVGTPDNSVQNFNIWSGTSRNVSVRTLYFYY